MKKMLRRPNSGINEEQAARIYDFLKFHARRWAQLACPPGLSLRARADLAAAAPPRRDARARRGRAVVAAVAFERVARGVVVEAVHSHLGARAQEVQDAVARFQRERALAVANWAEAEAMQLTIDSGDGKFAEDYLRRTIQDQDGTFAAAALPRHGRRDPRRGARRRPRRTARHGPGGVRGTVLGDAPVQQALPASSRATTASWRGSPRCLASIRTRATRWP